MADRRKPKAITPKRSTRTASRKEQAQQAPARGSAAGARGTPKAPARNGKKTSQPKRGAKRGTKRGAKRAAGARRASVGTKRVASRGSDAGTATKLMRIRALDPQATCGQGTTVMQLYRVDDLPFGDYSTHLVFFDRHGWYCEHGRDCPAVAAVRRHEKHVTLTR